MSEKVVLITGSNGGVGSQIASYLIENGHRNIACQVRSNRDKISQILKSYDLDPEKHIFFGDLTSENDVSNMREKIESQMGPVAHLANVAGSSQNSMCWKTSLTDLNKVFAGNVNTAFLCSKEFIPRMRSNGYGRIINFSSIVGFTGVVGAAHYSAAKSALVGLTKSMALELANKNICVNAIALGYFNFGLINEVPPAMQNQIKMNIPLNRFGEKEDVGALVQYLFSPHAGFMTGQALHLNGGQY